MFLERTAFSGCNSGCKAADFSKRSCFSMNDLVEMHDVTSLSVHSKASQIVSKVTQSLRASCASCDFVSSVYFV